MYRFKEQYRDAKISIPSIRLVVTSENVAQYAEIIYKSHREMLELVEDVKKDEPKKLKKPEEVKTISSPPLKDED